MTPGNGAGKVTVVAMTDRERVKLIQDSVEKWGSRTVECSKCWTSIDVEAELPTNAEVADWLRNRGV